MKRFLSLATYILFSFFCYSQHDSGSTFCTECMSFDQLWSAEVISASRKVQKKNEAAGSVIVITSDIISRRGYRTLEEVLEDVPGIDFTTKQPEGEYPTHFISRGITDVGQTNMLIIVDGVIRNDVSNGWMEHIGFDFPLIDVERIEVIFGPGSSLYGANAYAGIIYIITKNAYEIARKKQIESRVSYGSNNTVSPEVYYSAKFKNSLRLQATLQWYFTEGDRGISRPDPGNYFHNNNEPDSVMTTEFGKIVNEKFNGKTNKLDDGFNNSINDMHMKFIANHGNFTLGATYWVRNEGLGSEVVGYEYFANTEGIPYMAVHSGKTFFTKYEFDLNRHLHSLSLFSYRNTRILPQTSFLYTYQYQSVDNGIDSAVSDKLKAYFGDGSSIRFEQQFNLNIREVNELIFGFHAESQTRQYAGISLGSSPDQSSTIVGSTYPTEKLSVVPVYYSGNLSVFVQDETRFTDKYILTAGIRYDYDADFGSVFIPRIAFVASPVRNLSIKLLNGKAFKAPTIFQLYDEWRGNVNLKPQYITTNEMEIALKTDKRINFRGNFYFSDIRNNIVVAENPDTIAVPIGPNGEKETYYQNAGEYSISGASLFADMQIFKMMIISMNYSYTMRDKWQEIDNIAMNKFNISLNYNLKGNYNFNLRANFVGKVKAPLTNLYFYEKTSTSISNVGYDYVTEKNPDGYLESHTLFHFTFTVKNIFWKGIMFEPQIIIRNLLNTHYMTIGRQAGSGVRPVDSLQTSILNPEGYIPAYHPQAGREWFLRLKMTF